MAQSDSSTPRKPYACRSNRQSTSRSVLTFRGLRSGSPLSDGSIHKLKAGRTSVCKTSMNIPIIVSSGKKRTYSNTDQYHPGPPESDDFIGMNTEAHCILLSICGTPIRTFNKIGISSEKLQQIAIREVNNITYTTYLPAGSK